MTPATKQLARLLHSRTLMWLMAAALACYALAAWYLGTVSYIDADRGTLFPSANLWVHSHRAEALVNVVLTIGAASAMVLLSRVFNLLRTVSSLSATLFLCMSLASPSLIGQLFTGTPLVLTILACLFLTYSTYGNPLATPRVFLVFLLLSTGAMFQYCYAVYIPVFLVALAQMRIFTLRSLIAMGLGLITPWWIAFGSGAVSPAQVHFPAFSGMFAVFLQPGQWLTLAAVGLSAALLVAGWCLNLMKMLAYNAHLRAYTGTLSLLSLLSVVAVIVDFTNVFAYAPVLYMCTGFQLSHLVRANSRPETLWGIIAVMLIFLGLGALALIPHGLLW